MPDEHVGKNCPYCQTPIKPGVCTSTCSKCGIPHHAECWSQNRGCTTFGCIGGQPRSDGAVEPRPVVMLTPELPADQPYRMTATTYMVIVLAVLMFVGGILASQVLFRQSRPIQTVVLRVCRVSGQLAGPYCKNVISKTYTADGAPKSTCLTCTVPGLPAPFTVSEAKQLLATWLSAQNNRDVDAYSACYSSGFVGIKRTTNGKTTKYDYHGWLLDRKKMLVKTRDLHIDIADVTVTIDSDTSIAEANFTQIFKTSRYGDQGPKIMKLRKSDGKIYIFYEEMKWTNKL